MSGSHLHECTKKDCAYCYYTQLGAPEIMPEIVVKQSRLNTMKSLPIVAINTETGQEYFYMAHAARDMGILESYFYSMLNGKRKNTTPIKKVNVKYRIGHYRNTERLVNKQAARKDDY